MRVNIIQANYNRVNNSKNKQPKSQSFGVKLAGGWKSRAGDKPLGLIVKSINARINPQVTIDLMKLKKLSRREIFAQATVILQKQLDGITDIADRERFLKYTQKLVSSFGKTAEGTTEANNLLRAHYVELFNEDAKKVATILKESPGMGGRAYDSNYEGRTWFLDRNNNKGGCIILKEEVDGKSTRFVELLEHSLEIKAVTLFGKNETLRVGSNGAICPKLFDVDATMKNTCGSIRVDK